MHKNIGNIAQKPVKIIRQTLSILDRLLDDSFFYSFKFLHTIKGLRRLTTPLYKKIIYGRHRVTAASLALLIMLSILGPVYADYSKDARYALSSGARTLLGESNQNLTKKLTYNAKDQLYQFNTEGKKTPQPDTNPVAQLQSKVGGGGKNDEQLYSVDVAKDLAKGVTYYDNQSQLSFKMVPQFKTMPGQQVDGHLVYPLHGISGSVAYTLDAKGLKENVVLNESPGNELRMDYQLELPKSLEARLIPETGDLGIYSADPSLFGNISYGSSNDQELVEQARNNSAKSFLVFTVPAPFAVGIDTQRSSGVSSKFLLSNNVLTVSTKGLDQAQYPLAIDPSILVDSTSDFQEGNLEDSNSDINSGSLNRGALTGGATETYNSSPNMLAYARGALSSSVYNGKIYLIGGGGGQGLRGTVEYATLGSGSISTWTPTTSLPAARISLGSFAYNGYMYALGGNLGTTNYSSDVLYTKINSDGSLDTTWKTTTSFTTARNSLKALAYNGYAYITAGCSTDTIGCTTYQADTQYAKINADGTIGSWASAGANYTTARKDPGFVAYNNTMYIVGGTTTGNNMIADTQYAKINADGTIGSWTAAPPLPAARAGAVVSVLNGYLYAHSGATVSGNSLADTTYAQINANGSLGQWQSSTSTSTVRVFAAGATYNGYSYVIGGCTAANCPGWTADVSIAKIANAGTNGTYTTNATALPAARTGAGTVADGGYVYLVGGTTGSGVTSDVLSAPINSTTGALGSFANANTGTAFAARTNPGVTIANGYMYVVNGVNSSAASANDTLYALICTGTNSGVGGCGSTPGTVGTWGSTNALNINRSYFSLTTNNGYLYAVGGCNSLIAGSCGSYTATVSYALICTGSNNNVQGCNSTPGSTGTWNTTNSAGFYTSQARGYNAAFASGGYLYAVGGYNGSTYYNDIRYALICTGANSGVGGCSSVAGDTGTWADASASSFSGPRGGLNAYAVNGVMYVSGGVTAASTYAADTQYAKIASNGTVGSFSAGSSLATARTASGSAVYNGVAYSLGGTVSGGSSTASIEYTQLNSGGGGATTAVAANTSLNAVRGFSATVVNNGYVYLVGGCTAWNTSNSSCSAVTADTQYAKINDNGTLGTWASAGPSFTTGRGQLAAVAYSGYLYMYGGNSGSYLQDTQYAKINADGTIGTWTVGPNMNSIRIQHGYATVNGYLYAIGGVSSGGAGLETVQSTVESAKINADGSLSAWTSNTSLPGVRAGTTAISQGNRIYVLGGCLSYNTFGCTTFSNDVLTATVNASGVLSAWTPTASFTGGRHNMRAAIYNGYMYVVGGHNGNNGSATSAYLKDVQFAPIFSNGTLGQWSTSGVSLPAGRTESSLIAAAGNLYNIGGRLDTTLYADTQALTPSTTSRKTLYSKLLKFGVPVNVLGFNSVASSQNGSVRYRTAAANNIFSPTMSGLSPSCSELNTVSSIQLIAGIDDSYTVTADNAIAPSSIDSITVNTKVYVPPAKRLKHGAQFYQEAKQPFQTDLALCSM